MRTWGGVSTYLLGLRLCLALLLGQILGRGVFGGFYEDCAERSWFFRVVSKSFGLVMWRVRVNENSGIVRVVFNK